MRTTLVLAVVAALTTRAAAQDAPPPGFPLGDLAARATHILVVDARGVVLDVWKGDAAPGDVVPLGGLFSDAGSDPRDLSRVRHLRVYPYAQPPRTGATVLFLVKLPRPRPAPKPDTAVYGRWGSRRWESPPNPLADVGAAAFDRVVGWGHDPSNRYSWTARQVPSPGGWLPANPAGEIEASTACLDDAGLIRVLDRAPTDPGRRVEEVGAVPRWQVVGTADQFRWRLEEAWRANHAAGW